MRPVVDSFRRRTRAKGFHPYSQRPLTPFARPTRPPRSSIIPKLSPPTNHNSNDSSSQQSSSSDSVKMRRSDDDLILDYLQLQGTPHNPIHLDGSDNGLPQCDRCKQYGHAKQDCDTQLRSFLFFVKSANGRKLLKTNAHISICHPSLSRLFEEIFHTTTTPKPRKLRLLPTRSQ